MSVTQLAIKRPILFIVFFLVLAGFGIISYSKLKYELLPELATPYVTVTCLYPGASPKEVENAVTKKLEEAVAGVSRIKMATATSMENIAVLSLEFTADANADKAAQEVQQAINKVVAELPSGVKTPSVEKLNINDLPVLKLGVTAQVSPTELYRTIKDQIKPRLAQIKGAGRITILGGMESELKVAIDGSKLQSYQLSAPEVAEAIRKANNDFPVGSIKDGDRQFSIRLSGKMENAETVLNQVVRTMADGSTIKVRDVATVALGQKEATVISRLNGKASIGLFVGKQVGGNAVDISQQLKAAMQQLETDYASIGLHFDIAQDSAEFTLTAAKAVYKDFGLAVLLVALVMLVFLHSMRNAFIVLLAIPTSLVTAFILMYFMDYSLNLMTLLAMSLVIGILVDDSIVVLENIYRHIEMGKPREQAALAGRNEIGFAALSITLVDVVVFLPMAFVPGLVGSLVKEFSLVIVVSTLTSLVVSFTLTPMIASRFAKLTHLNPKSFFGRLGLWFEKGIQSLTNGYANVLGWSLRHKLATIAIVLVLLIGSVMLVTEKYVGAEFSPATDKGELSLLINLQPGSKLSQTDATVAAIEKKLQAVPEITKVFSNAGYQNDGFVDAEAPHLASINISLVPTQQRTKSLSDLGRDIKALAMEVPGVKARVSPIGLFGANDAPIQLLVSGRERDSVFAAANQILDSMRTINGVVSPRLSTEMGKPEMEIVVDREKAAALGINLETLGGTLRMAVNGMDELKLRQQENELDVRIQLAEADRASTDALRNYSVVNDKGQLIYLNQFAQVQLRSSSSALDRKNKQASVILLSQVAGRASGDVGNDIKAKLAGMYWPEGTAIKYAGDLELQDDSFGSLGLALMTSLLLIYLIMVALYNNWLYPFVVLFSIPVAVIGAFLALALTAKSLNIFSIFGLIMMMGLVAKNAILLVDRANDARREGAGLVAALLDAGRTRLRPILMTTLAMVIGMLPLALAKGAGAELNSGLAWVLIGGLTSSMFLTLLVVPVVYYVLTRLAEKWQNRRRTALAPILPQTVATAVLVMAFMAVQAQPVKPLTVAQAVQWGLQNNPQVRQAQLEQLKAQYNTKMAQADLYPNVAAQMNYTRNIKLPVIFFPTFGADPATGQLLIDDKKLTPLSAGTNNAYSVNVNINAPIYNPELRAGIQMTKLGTKVAEANVLLTQWQLADEIRKAYYQALMAAESQLLVHKTVERAQQNLTDVRGLFTKGMAADADTLNAWANVALLQAQVHRAQTAVQQAHNYLRLLLNTTDSITLSDSTLLRGPSALVMPQPTAGNGPRPDVAANEAQLQAAWQQIKLDKAKRLPSLNFVSQYNVQAQANDFKFRQYVWPNSFYVGVSVNIPIFAGFKNDWKIRQSKVAVAQLQSQQQQLNNQAQLEVNNAQLTLNDALVKIRATEKVQQAHERALGYIKARWKAGIAKFAEVSDAELKLTETANGLNMALYEFCLAKAAYEKAVGRIQ